MEATTVYLDNPLHRARLASGLDLSELAGRTHLSPRIVQQIDDGCFEELPRGVYARSYVRAFASAVGLEPDETLDRLSDQLPAVEDPLPALREIARRQTPPWVTALEEWNSAASAWVISLPDRVPWRPDGWRLPIARSAASCFDGIILLLLLASLTKLTAWTAGLQVHHIVRVAGPQLAVLWILMVLLYFLLLGGVGGRTPGASICGLPFVADRRPLRLRAIFERALRSAVG